MISVRGGNVANPESLNRYAYALNNPTTLTDPSGLATCYDSNGNGFWCPDLDPGSTSFTVSAGPPDGDYSDFSPGDPLLAAIWDMESCMMWQNCYVPMDNSGGGGGRVVTPPPKPAPKPKPDVPLNPFATAVFHRVYCGTQFLDRLPKVSGGGLFGFAGLEFQIPIVPLKGEALGIANYDTRAGFSFGALAGASTSHAVGPGAGVERSYDWRNGTWSTQGLGFFGAETEGLKLGAAGAGLLFGTQGAVGLYGQAGSFGGGAYLNLSYGGCQ